MGLDFSDVLGGIAAAGGFMVGGPIGAGLISGGMSMIGSDMTNQANASLAQAQDAFQMSASDTAYQRQVADMTAAGINPMVGYNSGGASTPSGNVIPMQNSIGTGATSAIQAYQVAKQGEQTDSQIGVNDADKMLKGAQATAQNASARQANANAATVEAGLAAAKKAGAFNSDHSTLLNWTRALGEVMHPVNSAVQAGSTFMP